MSGLCDGRVVIVTGAGGGIGRAHAVALAREGARVVVNDIGATVDGHADKSDAAQSVAEEIAAEGGSAVANCDDVSDFESARRLVETALSAFGRLDVLLNNAGIVRDRMLANMDIEEWDAVVRVHLRGTFSTMHWAADYFRTAAKSGQRIDSRIINTTSGSGLYGNPGQINYGAAKAGIAAMTIIASRELERYGTTVNAIAPAAMTRMTDTIGDSNRPDATSNSFADSAPEDIAPLAVWLASPHSRGVTGRVFNVRGRRISVAEGWVAGPSAESPERWNASELTSIIPELVSRAAPNAVTGGKLPQ
jgi:NAD(P)-dependent dehydrogenase (short-subunit alcohol dehydrogenase family)